MEFIGNNFFDETELKVRMAKFGNVKNMQNCDIAATCEKREFLFVTKLRNPFASPMSRYCGLFT